MEKKKISKKWVITTSGERPLSSIKKDLKEAGFDADETFDEIGVLIGSSSDKNADKLRAVKGITDVSPEPPPIDIGPPDSDIQ